MIFIYLNFMDKYLIKLPRKSVSPKPEPPIKEPIVVNANWILHKWLVIDDCKCKSEKPYKCIIKNLTNNEVISVCNDCYKDYPQLVSLIDELWHIFNMVFQGKLLEKIIISDELLKILNISIKGEVAESKRDILLLLADYCYCRDKYIRSVYWIFYSECGIQNSAKIIEYIDNITSKLIRCNQCKIMEPCIECFYKENPIPSNYLNAKQKDILWKVHNNIFNLSTSDYTTNCNIITGYPGTGKTTLLKYLISLVNLSNLFILKELRNLFGYDVIDYMKNIATNMVQNKLDEFVQNSDKMQALVSILYKNKVIVLSAPTNKALDVIKEKSDIIDNIDIRFMTVSKLMKYKKFYDRYHNLVFKRPQNSRNIFDSYNLIIIDECSMLSNDNMNDIKHDILAVKNKPDTKGYLLFTGDSLQLPPPKERFSAVFSMFKNKYELTTIMRTDKDNIMKISGFIRRWINGQILDESKMRTDLMNHKCEYVKFFKDCAAFIEDYLQHVNQSVILVWTNETRMKYNEMVRNKLFAKTREKYMPGERLIFNTFYKIKIDKLVLTYYSSMPITVISVNVGTYSCRKLFPEIINKLLDDKIGWDEDLDELKDGAKLNRIHNYIENFTDKFNRSIQKDYKVWELKFSYRNREVSHPLQCLFSTKDYTAEIKSAKDFIKDYFDTSCDITSNENVKEIIRELVIKCFDEEYIQPFADIDYGYCMTVDKSQGSGFENVYIDAPDILSKDKYAGLDLLVAKKRFYTGLTRASHMVNILL